ncbi:MAG: XdhC/CoxI family protein [Dermatophilaceae bacterium]
MHRKDYLDMLDQLDIQGIYSRVHWASGPKAGLSEEWSGDPADLPEGRPARMGKSLFNGEDGAYYVETLSSQPRLVICGGGHVSQPVAKIGSMLDFEVTVIDDRPEFTDPVLFPDADHLICGPYAETLRSLPPYKNTYYVVVTPGHHGDQVCAETILRLPRQYLGIIGSRAKQATVNKRMIENGFTQQEIDTIHAPIGIKIGGNLPAEVAVSICAELVQVRHELNAFVFDPDLATVIAKLAANPDQPAVMATIIGHAGSTPRGTGSRMIVYPDAELVGSVGGGAVENEVIQQSLRMFAEGSKLDLNEYDLSSREGVSLDMACGGRVRVLTEVL